MMAENEPESSSGPAAPTGPTANPFGPFNVSVLVPENIEIRMVDASTLSDYEIWFFIASLVSNAVVGFLVAYSQAVDAKAPSTTYIGYTLAVFVVLFLAALCRALVLRYVLRKKGKTIKLGVSSAAVTTGKDI